MRSFLPLPALLYRDRDHAAPHDGHGYYVVARGRRRMKNVADAGPLTRRPWQNARHEAFRATATALAATPASVNASATPCPVLVPAGRLTAE